MNLTIEFTDENDEGEEVECELPAKNEVCGRCEGTGTHVNPAIDGNGLTASDLEEWDEDDIENYMTGVYDVPCEECRGRNVVLVVDRETAEVDCPDLLKRYDEIQAAAADYRREQRYAERMGF